MFVSALLLERDGKIKKSVDHYLARFETLARTGLPLIIFLDRRLEGRVKYPNVLVEYTTIEDLSYYRFLSKQTIPFQYQSAHDSTLTDYFTVINSKTEFMMRAMDICESERFSWVDFGITHILTGQEDVLNRLRSVNQLSPGLIVPGSHPDPIDYQKELVWRFLGGFFTGLKEDLVDFHKHQVRAYEALFPMLDLEVKYWSYAEVHQGFRPKWYPANFGRYIFNFDRYLAT